MQYSVAAFPVVTHVCKGKTDNIWEKELNCELSRLSLSSEDFLKAHLFSEKQSYFVSNQLCSYLKDGFKGAIFSFIREGQGTTLCVLLCWHFVTKNWDWLQPTLSCDACHLQFWAFGHPCCEGIGQQKWVLCILDQMLLQIKKSADMYMGGTVNTLWDLTVTERHIRGDSEMRRDSGKVSCSDQPPPPS